MSIVEWTLKCHLSFPPKKKGKKYWKIDEVNVAIGIDSNQKQKVIVSISTYE